MSEPLSPAAARRLYEVATAITAAATPAQVAQVVLPAALEVGPATAGVLVALEAGDGGAWLVGASGDLPPSLVAWTRLSGVAATAGSPPAGGGDPLALTLRTGRPSGPSGEPGTVGAWPLLLNGRPAGALGLAGVAPAPAGDGQAVLPLLAQLSVLALERVRLQASLQDAARAQDAFLDRAAHDLRTPLTSLRGFTQLLLRQLRRTGSVEPQRLTPALLRIEEQTNVLTLLVTRLLDLGRLDAGGAANWPPAGAPREGDGFARRPPAGGAPPEEHGSARRPPAGGARARGPRRRPLHCCEGSSPAASRRPLWRAGPVALWAETAGRGGSRLAAPGGGTQRPRPRIFVLFGRPAGPLGR